MRSARRGLLGAAACVAAAFLSPSIAGAAARAPDWVLRARETALDAALLQSKPEPGAAVLWRQRIVTAAPSTGATRLYERDAVKILTPGGVESGTFYSHYDDDSKVDVEGAWTLHADGNAEALKLADVVSVQAANPEYFTDTFVLAFRPPRLAPGDIAAYALSRKSRRDVYQWFLELQGADPIAAQEIVIDLPEGWGHRWRLTGAVDGYTGPRNGEGGAKATYPFPAQRGLPPEQQAGARADLAAAMEISVLPPAGRFPELVFQSWNDVGAWFAKKSGAVRAAGAPASVPLFPGDAVREPARWVQDRIRYVALEAGEGGWVPREPALVTKRLYGDCKDKAFLLLALLARSGVEAYPVLTRGTTHGRIDPEFPSPVQFNHVIVAVRQPSPTGLPAEVRLKGNVVVVLFDPTSPWTPYGQLSAPLQGARGLLVRSDGGELVDFPFAPSAANRLARSIDVEITAEGGLRADVREVTDGALSERGMYQGWTPRERTDAIERFAEREIRGSRASALELSNLDDSSKPMEARFQVASESFLRTTGSLTLLPVLPFAIGPSRIASTGSERRFPIHLGAPERRELVVRFRPGAGLKIDSLPDPVSAENAYAAYRFAAALEDGRIVVRETYETKKASIPLADLAAWKSLESAAVRAAASKAVLLRTP